MMWITLQLNADLPEGTLVTHDQNNIWRKATSSDTGILGAVSSVENIDGVTWGRVMISGTTTVKAGANIPAQGGFFMSDDEGRAIISINPSAGIIAPLTSGASVPAVGDLILVHLR
jgi:hypothetical protein